MVQSNSQHDFPVCRAQPRTESVLDYPTLLLHPKTCRPGSRRSARMPVTSVIVPPQEPSQLTGRSHSAHVRAGAAPGPRTARRLSARCAWYQKEKPRCPGSAPPPIHRSRLPPGGRDPCYSPHRPRRCRRRAAPAKSARGGAEWAKPSASQRPLAPRRAVRPGPGRGHGRPAG